MTEKTYWIIDYKIEFSSDFHIGAGISLLGGNFHGLQVDYRGFPWMPQTEVRGLLRLGGQRLTGWDKSLEGLYNRNFGIEYNQKGLWSYTSARFPEDEELDVNETLGWQSHIKSSNGVAENLFTYQKVKSGRKEKDSKQNSDEADAPVWEGRIYSLKPAAIIDVAFLFACMRAEDRIGHRRSRGYGKISWSFTGIRHYSPGAKPEKKVLTETELLVWLGNDNSGTGNPGRIR